MGLRLQVLAARFNPLDGPSKSYREGSRNDLFSHKAGLGAEASTHIGIIDPYTAAVDAQEAGKRQTRIVKLYSDDYYQLLRGNSEFAKAQQLGWAVELNIGNERVVVEKDGQRKDEKLRVKDQSPVQNFQRGPNSGGGPQQQLPRDLRNESRQNVPKGEQQNQLPRNRD